MCRPSRRKFVSKAICSRLLDNEHREVKYRRWHQWAVAAAAFFCYLNSLTCGLVFDDQPAIRDNMDIRPTTPLSSLFYNDFWGTPMHREESHKSYRPLCVLTFRINYWLHELHPMGYHFVNVMLHTLVCVLYHRLCSNFLPSTPSLVAAMLFAVHPIHTEAVTGVVGRAELLSSIFFLMALKTHIRSLHQSSPVGYQSLLQSLILAGLAMLCKEQGITVVAICTVYDVLLVQESFPPPVIPERAPRGKIKGPTPTWRKDLVLRLLVMTMGSTLFLTMRMKVMGSTLPTFNKFDNPAVSAEWPVRYLTYNYLFALNAWLLFFPSDLLCDWTMGTVPLVTSLRDVRVAGTLLLYAVISALVWKSFELKNKNSGGIIIGLSLCIFPFIPASNLLYPVGFVVAERVLYLSSMGFCFLVSLGWYSVYRLVNRKTKTIVQTCLVIILCLNAFKTIRRNFDWQSEETLFRSGLKVTQANAKLYNNLGHVLESRQQHLDALQLFLQAAQIQPDDLGSHLNVGRLYNQLGMTEEAEKAFRMAKNLLPKVRPGQSYRTHIVPKHMDLFLDLGNLLSKNESRLEEAQQLYREAINMKSDYVEAYLQRASVLLKLNRSEEAHDVYKEALKHDHKNPDIFYNIGVLLLEKGKSVEALEYFDQALTFNPEHEKSLLNFAILSQDSGDSNLRRVAHERLQVLLEKGHQPGRTYFNLGVLAMQDGDPFGAEQCFRKTLQLKPDFDAAIFNLAFVLHEQGRPLEALPYLEKLGGRHLKGLVLLGNIYFKILRNYTAAERCYELILEQEPSHVVALHNLCATRFQMGMLKMAESCIKRIATFHPEDQHTYKLQLSRAHRNLTTNQSYRKSVADVIYCSRPNTNCDFLYKTKNDARGTNSEARAKSSTDERKEVHL